VVDDLKRAFPKVQFIVTTHSPFIIQSAKPGELIQLDAAPGGEHVDAEEYVERSIEEVADLVQGVDGRMSREREEMFRVAEEYYKALQEGKQANPERQRQLKQQLDELEAPYMGNVAYHAFLRMERIAAGLGDED
jgi:predicted ATP-binding protein involved in virulence